MRDNILQHNGFNGVNIWTNIHTYASANPILKRLVSGAHSSLNMHISNSLIDKPHFKSEEAPVGL